MKSKRFFLLAVLFAVTVVIFAGTHDPWDGTKWDVDSPDINQLIGNHYKEMYDLRRGVGIRMDKEHETMATSSAGGVHIPGSAVAWHLATGSIPALQPNGDAFDSGDKGRLWHDITTDIFYVLDDDTDPTVGGGWVVMGHYLGDIAINTDKFTVARASGNTVIAGTLNVADLITKSPWVDVRAHIASGAGTSGDPWILDDLSAFKNIKFSIAGYYQLSADWNLLSGSYVWGTKGVFLDDGGFTLECSGTVSATTTDFTADGAKGATSITVADEGSFSASDWIEISAAKDVYTEWATKTLPRELNRVVSTSVNTIVLKYPLRREYDYDGGYSDNPTVTLITTVKENVVIENINIQADLTFGYISNFALRGITTEVLSISQVAKSFEITNVEAILPLGTGDNGAVSFEGASEGLISIRIYGAKDGIRIFGCAEISGSVIVKQCDQRGVWIYGSDDINLSPVHIMGTRSNAINSEIILFDFSGFCSVRNAFIKEPNKDTSFSQVEFRSSLGLCEFTDSVIYCYSSTPIVVKPESLSTIIDRNTIHLVSDVTGVVRIESGVVSNSNSSLKIRGNEIVNDGDTAHLLRTASTEEWTGNDYKYIEVSGNRVPVATDQFLCNLAGVGGTQGVETVVVRDNVVDVLNSGSGGLFSQDTDMTITNLIFHGNVEVGNTGEAISFQATTNIMFGDDNFHAVSTNSAGKFRVTAPKQIGTLASEGTPSASGADIWKTGGTTTITDLDDTVAGQIVRILCKHSLTFDFTTGQDADHNLDGSSVDITADTGDILQFLSEDGTTLHLMFHLDASVNNN